MPATVLPRSTIIRRPDVGFTSIGRITITTIISGLAARHGALVVDATVLGVGRGGARITRILFASVVRIVVGHALAIADFIRPKTPLRRVGVRCIGVGTAIDSTILAG